MRLYSYHNSSAAYRVRIALALKGLAYETVPINLVRNGGEQLGAAYRKINPQALVPALETGEGLLTQSLAIIEWLEERYPEPRLLPQASFERARVRAFALAIACEIHPLNNRRVRLHLAAELGADEAAVGRWYRHWVEMGFAGLEPMLDDGAPARGFCFAEPGPGLADACLVPQMANARRFNCDLSRVPRLVAVDEALRRRPEFKAAAPEAQPDAGT
jgi:maleylacetoacetate isomerase